MAKNEIKLENYYCLHEEKEKKKTRKMRVMIK